MLTWRNAIGSEVYSPLGDGPGLAARARDSGARGLPLEYDASYYAAFLRNIDEIVIEVVTFLPVES